MSTPRQSRSGCALVLGILLIGAGSLLLAFNLFGLSLAGLWVEGLRWFRLYWPVALILWGLYKIGQRWVSRESSRIGAGEVILLCLIVMAGLTLGVVGRFAERLPVEVSLEKVIESFEPEMSLGPAQTFTEEHRFELPAERGLQVENDRGAITVQGWDETDLKVKVTKRVYLHAEDRASRIGEDISVRLEISAGGPARLVTETPPTDHPRVPIETDLEIWLPRQNRLTLSNRRGPLRVSHLEAPVALTTTNDTIEVTDIEGPVEIDGRRGPLRIERIRGDVEARNRYGTISVKDIQGDLIGETSNGSIEVAGVTGSARLTNRHSRIRASRIGRDLTIQATHTEVFVEEAGAAVSIETSYRPVFVRGVEGRLDVDARNSDVEVRDVKGDLEVDNIYESVTAANIGGGTIINAQRCNVQLQGMVGPIEVKNSYHPLEIHGFQSSLIVSSEHAPLYVATGKLGGELKLATSYGDVTLSLPPESSFRLHTIVKGGRIRSDFRQENWEETKREERVELMGTAGGGASPIFIETSYGNVSVLETGGRP